MSASERVSAFGIAGKRALITGGNRNIGRAIALAFAEAGAAPVILFHEDEAAARKVCAEVAEKGVEAAMYQADLADVERLRAIVRDVDNRLGGVDILVNNAAIRPNSKISEITIEEWDQVFATNLRAPFFLAQAVLPNMVRKRWGRIVNLGGTDGYLGKPRRAHGVAAKLGIAGLTRALAVEVARFGVTVNTLVPGTIDTVRPHPEWYPGYDTGFAERKERIPMVRLGEPREVADACLFLSSNLAGYTTAQELFVNGGAYPLVRQPLEEYEAEDF
jgi:3-oxoacyl-[acyl-carrier protein] reductase